MVCIVKNALKKVVGRTSLDRDQLNTVLIEIGNIINSRPLTYISEEHFEASLTPYHLIYGRNIAVNKVSFLNEDMDRNFIRLNYNKVNILLKHFSKRFTEEYLSLLHELYSYRDGRTDENCRIYVGDIVLTKENFVTRMKWRKAKVLNLIRGKVNKVRGAELLIYNRETGKTSTLRRTLQLIMLLEIETVRDTKQNENNTHCPEPAYEYTRKPRRDAAKNADLIRKLMVT